MLARMPNRTPIHVCRLGCWLRNHAAVMTAVMVDMVDACMTAGTGMCCSA